MSLAAEKSRKIFGVGRRRRDALLGPSRHGMRQRRLRVSYISASGRHNCLIDAGKQGSL